MEAGGYAYSPASCPQVTEQGTPQGLTVLISWQNKGEWEETGGSGLRCTLTFPVCTCSPAFR